MCSIHDENEVNFMENESAPPDLINLNCKKCAANKAEVILRKRDQYCNSCFVENVTHKFRASLGKTKIVRHGDKVLIAFSGDGSSCTLLNLIETGLKEETHKKLKFQPVALYIDEGVIFNESSEKRNEKRKKITELVTNHQLSMSLYSTTLSDVVGPKPRLFLEDDTSIVSNELDEQVKKLISMKNLTTKQDVCKKLRCSLLLKCAEELDCKFVFLAQTATKLAATLLCDVSLGAGSHLSSDVNFCDSRHKIKILRPLKDFTSEELDHFISLNKISFLHHRSLITDDNPYASIQSLTSKFVKDLQKDFPATISTILRTGEKLENKSNESTHSDEDICALCLSLLDTQLVPCSALEATNYSKLISNTLQDNKVPSQDISSKCETSDKCGDCHCQTAGSSITKEDVKKFLCYSCRLIIKDIKDVNHLPTDLISSIQLKKSLTDTRNEIKDFLL